MLLFCSQDLINLNRCICYIYRCRCRANSLPLVHGCFLSTKIKFVGQFVSRSVWSSQRVLPPFLAPQNKLCRLVGFFYSNIQIPTASAARFCDEHQHNECCFQASSRGSPIVLCNTVRSRSFRRQDMTPRIVPLCHTYCQPQHPTPLSSLHLHPSMHHLRHGGHLLYHRHPVSFLHPFLHPVSFQAAPQPHKILGMAAGLPYDT